jgi:hypothetical protein
LLGFTDFNFFALCYTSSCHACMQCPKPGPPQAPETSVSRQATNSCPCTRLLFTHHLHFLSASQNCPLGLQDFRTSNRLPGVSGGCTHAHTHIRQPSTLHLLHPQPILPPLLRLRDGFGVPDTDYGSSRKRRIAFTTGHSGILQLKPFHRWIHCRGKATQAPDNRTVDQGEGQYQDLDLEHDGCRVNIPNHLDSST